MTAERRRAVVVIPTYDEKENIADLIAAVLSEQAQVPAFDLHVLVADSHSLDGTLDIVAARGEFPPGMRKADTMNGHCLLYTSPSPRDRTRSRMPSSA